jgi:integrase
VNSMAVTPGSGARAGLARVESGDWRLRLSALIAKHCKTKVKGDSRTTSHITQKRAFQNVMQVFEWLRRELGFPRLANPMSLDERHFKALAGHIRAKVERGEFGPAQAAGYATYCRHLARWIGKPEFVTVFSEALGRKVCKRQLVAQVDKSWEGNGLDPEKLILEVARYERWVGLVLLAQHAFGLRKMEALRLRPMRDIGPARVAGTGVADWSMVHIYLVDGTKGGRPRVVDVSDPLGVSAALLLREEIKHLDDREFLPPPQFTLAQNQYRYESVMARFGITKKALGVTGHGLRAGFACDRLEAAGITPTVRGGDGQHADPVHQLVTYKQLTEAMGHGRISVVGAYAGAVSPHSARKKAKAEATARRLAEIETLGPLEPVAGAVSESAVPDLRSPAAASTEQIPVPASPAQGVSP